MRLRLAFATAALVALTSVGAAATPQTDFDAVYGDWQPDKDVTACRFSQAQLQNAGDVANGSPEFQYETDFPDEVQREIARWKAGGCAGVSPFDARRLSPLYGAKIVAVVGRGSVSKELVRIRNRSRKTLSFRRATLRNKDRRATGFPAKFKLRPAKTAIVRVGCQRGKRKASFKGTRVWLCRRPQLFRDRGDAARLADAKGTVVSQRGFGTEIRRLAY